MMKWLAAAVFVLCVSAPAWGQTNTPTDTPTDTPTSTPTVTPTNTPTPTPTITNTPTVTPYPTAAVSCCDVSVGTGSGPFCNDATCMQAVCAGSGPDWFGGNGDIFCCTDSWDTQCAEEALGQYTVLVTALCACAPDTPTPTPTINTPTITETPASTPTQTPHIICATVTPSVTATPSRTATIAPPAGATCAPHPPTPACTPPATPFRLPVVASADDGVVGAYDQDSPPSRHPVFWTDGNVNQSTTDYYHQLFTSTDTVLWWNTSSLANRTVVSVSLQMCCVSKFDADNAHLIGDWLTASRPVQTQYTEASAAAACDYALSTFTVPSLVTLPLAPTGIDVDGASTLRLSIVVTPTPTAFNELNCYAQDSDNRPALIGCAEPFTPTPTP